MMSNVLCIETRKIVKEDKTYCAVRLMDESYDVYELFFSGDSSVIAQTLRKGSTYDLVLGMLPAYRGSGFRYVIDDFRQL